MKSFIKKRDLILLGALLAAALLSALFLGVSKQPAARASISAQGQEVMVLDLSEDTEADITGKDGSVNHFVVKDGEIWCSEASCPDGLCIRQGKKSLEGDTIVCLPNQVIVTILQ